MEVEVWRSFWPKKAPLTEQNLSDQAGKVFIVTGASSGVGEKLAQILYQHNATIYVATRSEKKTNEAIARIKKDFQLSKGTLVFLHLDLGDLTTIKTSALAYLAREATLDTIWLNAGVMFPPQGSKTV
ncbi:short-chain dehydrogenase [Fusarium albosuccineum]|uniref:Short-chain dehydrogenase n=1 Tax=Fusarium albosuccineum TaxID=1237068 RepID=A0A8H4KDN9_9HYPO|nr:short-chain dehydrogenase [Fusarium albosuccineum]